MAAGRREFLGLAAFTALGWPRLAGAEATGDRYTEDHQWVRVDGGIATVGLTRQAARGLGEIVFVELPAVGQTLARDDLAWTVDSVKTAAEVYCPVSGEVIEINAELSNRPELINEDPEGKGWLFKMRLADPAELIELMDAGQYKAYWASIEAAD